MVDFFLRHYNPSVSASFDSIEHSLLYLEPCVFVIFCVENFLYILINHQTPGVYKITWGFLAYLFSQHVFLTPSPPSTHAFLNVPLLASLHKLPRDGGKASGTLDRESRWGSGRVDSIFSRQATLSDEDFVPPEGG